VFGAGQSFGFFLTPPWSGEGTNSIQKLPFIPLLFVVPVLDYEVDDPLSVTQK
jgi:hypothetical protein